MASSEALVKYYDTLRNSFNKIQDKDNKTSLINAALRPKIREEFQKSEDVLKSYLDYIKVFSVIYSDQFSNVCTQILAPLFKEIETTPVKPKANIIKEESSEKRPEPNLSTSEKFHDTISSILKSKSVLMNDFVHSIIKIFPTAHELKDDTTGEIFIKFLKNSLRTCTYLSGEPLLVVISKILDRTNWIPGDSDGTQDQGDQDTKTTLALMEQSHEIIYNFLTTLHPTHLDRVGQSVISAFTGEFLGTKNAPFLNYLLFYTCSFNTKLSDLFLEKLWTIFNDTGKSFKERKASIAMASSFIARANFMDLSKTMWYLDVGSKWCHKYLDVYHGQDHLNGSIDSANETLNLFIALCHSMLYLITQRYREMYEEETIRQIVDMNFVRLLDNSIRPLGTCDTKTRDRFQEVAVLYNIPYSSSDYGGTPSKKQKVDSSSKKSDRWTVPFKETCNELVPPQVQPHYRSYYNHRNFTVYRE